ncbi:TY-Chap2 family putative peptide chaperone [Demequina lignilytica]|uniref:TY-Chap2 family putative peptide chaperone n=1 Tax=Demequina lignilytica TaxID=3051663 RepID=UPI003F733A77
MYRSAPAHAWVLMRDLEPVALFDLYEYAHTEREAVDLFARYSEQGSSIGSAVLEGLGKKLLI